MSVEQYSIEVVIVAATHCHSDLKMWLHEERMTGLAGDLRWLCEEEDMDAHVVLDLTDLASLETASYGLMMNLQRVVKNSDNRFVLCGLSPHVKWQLKCVHLSDQFDTFDTREAAITELTPQDVY